MEVGGYKRICRQKCKNTGQKLTNLDFTSTLSTLVNIRIITIITTDNADKELNIASFLNKVSQSQYI